MSLIPVTDAVMNPDDVLKLSEFKAFVVDAPDSEDSEIQQAINSAVEDLEEDTGRAYGQRTYDLVLDSFPSVICLPKPPLVSVTSVKYIDSADVEQTLTVDTDYTVHGVNVTGLNNRGEYGGYIKPSDNGWPSDVKDGSEVVTIRFVAGYASPNKVPSLAKQAARLRTGRYYSFKGDVYDSEVDQHYRNAISKLIVYSFV
jgi:uncharacterized phiE125 gp8 family phage protein